ncbi:MAG: ribonuclease III [Bacteroidia bacterium]|nr:ribonuclease III [Bacteroidia bacterium]
MSSLQNLLGFNPGNISVYKLAFRHRSAASEHSSGIKLSNERLEYLGDAVLGTIIAEMLFKKYPYKEEGFLTEMRSRIVNREHLNRLAMKLGIDQMMSGFIDPGSKTRSAYGDAFEALVGAVYIDKGYNTTRKMILSRIVKNHIHLDEIENQDSNFKSRLINWSQRERKKVEFEFLEEVDNGGKRLLRVRVLVDGTEMSRGEDFSKKRAEQIAAEKACASLGI